MKKRIVVTAVALAATGALMGTAFAQGDATIPAYDGVFAAEMIRTNTNFVPGMEFGFDREVSDTHEERVAVDGGDAYSFKVWLRSGTVDGLTELAQPTDNVVIMRMAWFTSSHIFIRDSPDELVVLTDTYQQFELTDTAPSNAAYANIALRLQNVTGSFVCDLLTLTNTTAGEEETITNNSLETWSQNDDLELFLPDDWRGFIDGGAEGSIRRTPGLSDVSTTNWQLYE